MKQGWQSQTNENVLSHIVEFTESPFTFTTFFTKQHYRIELLILDWNCQWGEWWNNCFNFQSYYFNNLFTIYQDIYSHNPNVAWDDIIGLDDGKRLLKEAVVYPIKVSWLTSLSAHAY